MTHDITTFSQPTDMIILFIAALVFFLSFGFTLWKALSDAKSTIYWQITLCLFLIGIGITCFSAMKNDLSDEFLMTGIIFLTLAALLTIGGIVRNIMRFYINNRLQEKWVPRYR